LLPNPDVDKALVGALPLMPLPPPTPLPLPNAPAAAA
tara:strand:+ start:127 stop:237 length:111 start_codon:yes stop_codon:yes gene_type:complete